MSYCSSCGSSIPDGQERSCSMCYGDVGYGKDRYYERWIEEQLDKERLKRDLDRQIEQRLKFLDMCVSEEPPPHKDDF